MTSNVDETFSPVVRHGPTLEDALRAADLLPTSEPTETEYSELPSPARCSDRYPPDFLEKQHHALEALRRELERGSGPAFGLLISDVPHGLMEQLEEAVTAAGFTLHFEDCRGRRYSGLCDRAAARIIVDEELNPPQRAAVLAHELGHAYDLHGCGTAEREAFANAVGYMVCAHFGLDVGPTAAWLIREHINGGAPHPCEVVGRLDWVCYEILNADAARPIRRDSCPRGAKQSRTCQRFRGARYWASPRTVEGSIMRLGRSR